MKPWLQYSLIRLGVFAIVFTVLMLASVPWWLSAIIAAVIGFCVAYIFFGKLRDRVALDLQAARTGSAKPTNDESAEDAALER